MPNEETGVCFEAESATKPKNIIAIASGKGGVGKTWFSISLAHYLCSLGRRILLIDGDLGLANIDIQLGISPDKDLGDFLDGHATLAQIRSHHPEGFDMIVGCSGVQSLADFSTEQTQRLIQDIYSISKSYDYIMIDLGAGIQKSILQLVLSSTQCLVVVSPEPTSITDAYALMKLVWQSQPDYPFEVVVNKVNSKDDGEKTYSTLENVCKNFLSRNPKCMGFIRRDPRVADAIRQQTLYLSKYPTSDVAKDIAQLSKALI